MNKKGAREEDQKGVPDDMSCAGIFGNDRTKTVVMEHHGMNGFRASPLHPRTQGRHRTYENPVRCVH